MRQLRMWKIGTVFAVFGAITIATSHLESYAQQRAHDLVGQACWSGGVEALPACLVGLITSLTMQVSVLFGLLTAILFVVYAYTYTLKGLSTYLPWYLSLGVSSGLFVLGRFQAPVAHLLVEVLVHGYPSGLQDDFLAVAAWGAPLASYLMKASTLVMGGMQFYVILRLGAGFLRHGEKFVESKVYRRWSEPVESYPGIIELSSEYIAQWQKRFSVEVRNTTTDKSRDRPTEAEPDTEPKSDTDQTASHRRVLSTSQLRAKKKSREAGRAARRARKIHR